MLSLQEKIDECQGRLKGMEKDDFRREVIFEQLRKLLILQKEMDELDNPNKKLPKELPNTCESCQ